MLSTINEKSTATLTIDFIDENGTAVTPTGGTYRIDTTGGAVIVASTPFTPVSSSYDIALSVANNTIQNTALPVETRIVSITWQYATSKQGTAEVRYSVKNLRNI